MATAHVEHFAILLAYSAPIIRSKQNGSTLLSLTPRTCPQDSKYALPVDVLQEHLWFMPVLYVSYLYTHALVVVHETAYVFSADKKGEEKENREKGTRSKCKWVTETDFHDSGNDIFFSSKRIAIPACDWFNCDSPLTQMHWPSNRIRWGNCILIEAYVHCWIVDFSVIKKRYARCTVHIFEL